MITVDNDHVLVCRHKNAHCRLHLQYFVHKL